VILKKSRNFEKKVLCVSSSGVIAFQLPCWWHCLQDKNLHAQHLHPAVDVLHVIFQQHQPTLQPGNPGSTITIIVIARWRCVAARTLNLPIRRHELLPGSWHLTRDAYQMNTERELTKGP
jgi:hypothetical protein